MRVIFARGCIVSNDQGTYSELYFSAPAKYLGDKRFAYTYSMSFLLQQDSFTSRQNSTKGDVILRGRSFDQVLVTSLGTPGPMFTKFEVKFMHFVLQYYYYSITLLFIEALSHLSQVSI